MLNDEMRPEGCTNCICTLKRGCDRCGFNKPEADRRREIPLTLCKDGLMRKLIPVKPPLENANEKSDS